MFPSPLYVFSDEVCHPAEPTAHPIGRSTPPPRHVLLSRSFSPEPLRTPRLRLYHLFPSPFSIQVPSATKRDYSSAFLGALCELCETDEGAFDSSVELLGGEEGGGGGEREEFADERVAVRGWGFGDRGV